MKQYRQDLHSESLGYWFHFWFFGGLALLFQTPRCCCILLGIGTLAVGFALTFIYDYRASHYWLSVLPEQGIGFAGRGVIRWEEIRSVERRRSILRRWIAAPSSPHSLEGGFSLAVVLIMFSNPLGGPLTWPGGILWVLALGVGILTALRSLLVPLLEVLFPIGDRIRIHHGIGVPLVLRDLRDADAFLLEVNRRWSPADA